MLKKKAMAKKKITEEEQPQIISYNVLIVRAELRRLIALVGEVVVSNELKNIIGKKDEQGN